MNSIDHEYNFYFSDQITILSKNIIEETCNRLIKAI